MGPPHDANTKDPKQDLYQDAVRTLEATQEVCQRLNDWAMRKFNDPGLALSIHELAQYCKAIIQQFNLYITDQKPLLQSDLVREQVRRSLEALGLESNADSMEQRMQILQVLLDQCKQRTLEVVNLFDTKLAEVSRKNSNQRRQQVDVAARDAHDYQRFFKAAKAVHENNVMRSKTPYMVEKRSRVAMEAEAILQSIFAFGQHLNDTYGSGHREKPSAKNIYPEEAKVSETLSKFWFISIDTVERLQTLTDPLNVSLYQKSSDVPYKEEVGVPAGRGSFGIVYKAENTQTRSVVAIKQLSGIYSSKDQGTVRKELSMLEICDHPNIVQLLHAYQIEGDSQTFHLVMDPWAPYTLKAFLHESDSQRHHSAPWFMQGDHETEIQILRGLADGLGYLHDKSIKHKDLKPENILLYDATPGGIRPIIADLGLSKVFRQGTPTDYIKSTYAYLAREQLNSTGSTLRSDVWQLGCCFALILAVFRGGSAGCRQLWDSFENSDTECSCNIALEATAFMKAFKSLCECGSVSQHQAYLLTTEMLEIDPERRRDIDTVRTILADWD